MKRILGLTAIAALLVGTMYAHRVMAASTVTPNCPGGSDNCTGVEVCTNASTNVNLTCNQAGNTAVITATFTVVAPICVAQCCDHLAALLAEPGTFVRVPPIPNIADCCVFSQSTTFPIPNTQCSALGF